MSINKKSLKNHFIQVFIGTVYLISMISGCSRISESDPTGFGRWSDDCSGIALAVNKADWDGGLFMNHETNERCDLYICDTNGKVIRTVFTERKVDGAPSSIDSLVYDKMDGYITLYSKLYGTGKVKKEVVNLTDLSIGLVEYIDVLNWYTGYQNMHHCNGKDINWNYELKWIEIQRSKTDTIY